MKWFARLLEADRIAEQLIENYAERATDLHSREEKDR